MKLEKGTYEGASTFAQFDKKITEMTNHQRGSLLEFILQVASPTGEHQGKMTFNEKDIFSALQLAEQLAREQGVNI